VSDSSHKGNFSTDIAQQVIEEALRSVTRRSDSPSDSTSELAALQSELEQAKTDLEDYKKRARKEKEELQRFGVEKLLHDVLPVADNLDRALEHARTDADFEALRKGLQMTKKLLKEALAKNGVESFSAAGKLFDPQFHEAIQQVESANMAPHHVLSEVLCGYLLNGRLARAAQVVVSKALGPDSPEGALPR
jgi:molecular chaperone GrpE